MMAQLLVQCGVSFIAVLAFAILFHAPRREWAPCGLTGMVGWVVYWLAVQGGVSVVAASFCGTLALALLSRVLAVVRRCPVTPCFSPAAFSRWCQARVSIIQCTLLSQAITRSLFSKGWRR